MKIERQKQSLDVHDADLSGSAFADASIVKGRLEGMTIEGIPVTELLAFWRAGHEAQSA